MKIAIVNTGVGNVKSVANMLKRVRHVATFDATISDAPDDVLTADALILPGVGSFDVAMERMAEKGLVGPLNEAVMQRQTTVLGLCLGMQLLANGSDEGRLPGFGWIPGHFKLLEASARKSIRVPHMGWNIVTDTDNCVLYDGMGDEVRFYFDHSFALVLENPSYYCGKVSHGITFAAGIRSDYIFGVQFHPEKSHRFGLKLFENFVRYAAHRANRPLEAAS